jgi:hypothetical protein
MADFHSRIAAMKGKLTVLLVVVGINAAATLAVFGTLWQLTALSANSPTSSPATDEPSTAVKAVISWQFQKTMEKRGPARRRWRL